MPMLFFLFFFNDTATTEIYTLSLHDALPILVRTVARLHGSGREALFNFGGAPDFKNRDRKSTRLNSSHTVISYAVFCLKKKNSTMTSSSIISRSPTTDSHALNLTPCASTTAT